MVQVINGATAYSQRVTNNVPLMNDTNSFENYLTLSTAVPSDGEYLLKLSYYFSLNSAARNFLAHIENDGNFIFPVHIEPKDVAGAGSVIANTDGGTTNTGTDQFIPVHRETIIQLTEGEHFFSLEFACQQAGDRATIYEAFISLERV